MLDIWDCRNEKKELAILFFGPVSAATSLF